MPADARFKPQKESNRVKAQLRRLEKEKSKSFPDLGKATYQAFIEGRVKDPALAEACGRLKSIDERIEEGNAELERLKGQAQQMRASAPRPGAACPYCKAPIAPGASFCGNCGKGLSAVAPTAAPGAAPCPSCGSPISPGAAFCGECGKPFPKTAPPPGPPPPPPAAPSAPTPLGGTPPGPPKAVGPLSSPPKPPARKPASPPVTVKPPPKAAAPAAPGAADSGAKPSGEGKPGATGGRPGVCPSCSAPTEEPDATFCGECGKKL